MKEKEKITYNLLLQNDPSKQTLNQLVSKSKPGTSYSLRRGSTSENKISKKPMTSYKHIRPSSFEKNY